MDKFWFEKEAFDARQVMSAGKGVLKTVASHPVGKAALVGAGTGAVTNVVAGDSNKSVLSRATTGAAVGGVLGGAGKAIASKIKPAQQVSSNIPVKVNKPDISMSNQGGTFQKAAFWIGFEKDADARMMLGKAFAKVQKAPAQVASAVKELPATAKKGVEAVKDYAARGKQAVNAGHAREMGFGNRAKRPDLDLSGKSQFGRINTGKASPESIRQAKGSLGSRVKNVGTALAVGGAAGAYYGMKDPENEQRR